jgi:hypothetical protein
MSEWPAPTRTDHERFCLIEGWTQIRDARGRQRGHHVTYEYVLPDGRILRTRISHPVNRNTYGPSLWSHILRDQLQVDEATFWAALEGVAPDRGAPAIVAGVPAEIAVLLEQRVHLSSEEIAAMGRDEAIARLNRFWAEGI